MFLKHETKRTEMNRQRLIIWLRILYPSVFLGDCLKAIGMSLNLQNSSINTTTATDAGVIISGLAGDFQIHSFRNLSGFDFRISYANALLRPDPCVAKTGPELVVLRKNGADVSANPYLRKFGFRSHDALDLAVVSVLGENVRKNDLAFSDSFSDEDQSRFFSVTLGEGRMKNSERFMSGSMLFLGSAVKKLPGHGFKMIQAF